MLSSNQYTRGFINSVGNNNFLNFVSQNILHQLAQLFKFGFLFFLEFLLFLSLIQVKTFLCARLELLGIVFLQLLDHIFINRVNQVENFNSSLSQSFKERRLSNSLFASSSNIIDIFLAFFHSLDILLQ